MRPKNLFLLFALGMTILVQGCIAFPPLIQVEHKQEPPPQAAANTNEEVLRRLESIDKRLEQLEKDKKTP